MKLGPNIRALLDEKGMSQSELAARAHVEVDYMNAIMHADMDQNGPLPLKAMIMRIADVLGVPIEALINPEAKRMQRPTNDGHVKVLMSCRFNNFEASRPLPPGATDEEYDDEFEKAMQTVQRALDRFENLSDDRAQFNALCDEYQYMLKVEKQIQSRDLTESPLTDTESKILDRLELIQSVIEGFKHPMTWDDLLSREEDESDMCF